MPRKYDVIDELIKDELREFLLWLQREKKIELCEKFNGYKLLIDNHYGENYFPIHKAPEDLINEYMEIE